MQTLATYRPPFGFIPEVRRFRAGASVAEMAASFDLPLEFWDFGAIVIGGREVPRHLWHLVRPREGAEVTYHSPILGGGGGGGGKNVLATVAAIALVVASAWVAGGGLLFLGQAFAAGNIGAIAAAGAVSLVGGLAISALTPTPSLRFGSLADDTGRTEASTSAFASGNVLEPNGQIPRVIGQRKTYPPYACEPFVYYEGDDEFVEGLYVLAGPHDLSDVRIDGISADAMAGVEYQISNGLDDDPQTLITRYTTQTTSQTQFVPHSMRERSNLALDLTNGLEAALPQPILTRIKAGCDEHQLQIIFPQGINKNASISDPYRVPFRMRMRQRGTETWRNLPDLHFRAAQLNTLRAVVRLVFTDSPSGTSYSEIRETGWVDARTTTFGQDVAPLGADYDADAYFYDGSGDVYLSGANLGTTGVLNVDLDRYQATIELDSAEFPDVEWDLEVKMGMVIRSASYDRTTDTFSGEHRDWWGYREVSGDLYAPDSRDGIVDTSYMARSVSIWNSAPITATDLASIAIRARSRTLENVTVLAGGLVPDWDGSQWTGMVVTENPAPHLRELWCGASALYPLPADQVDDSLVDWRAHCATEGYTCNAVLDSQSVDEAATLIAATGYARPRMSETWGVIMDYDRSAETPVQIFTPRNSAGFSWARAFPIIPDGFRVTFNDALDNWEATQVIVPDGASGVIEQVTYNATDNEDEARARAEFDLAQAEARGTIYSWTAPAEAIVCQRGDLVGVVQDSLSYRFGQARIIGVTFDVDTMIESIEVDDLLPVVNEPDMLNLADMLAVDDMLAVGSETGIAIRRSSGITTHPVDNATGDTTTITFDPSLDPSGVAVGQLVAVGTLGSEMRRLIITSITPRQDLVAEISAVAEAPELWT